MGTDEPPAQHESSDRQPVMLSAVSVHTSTHNKRRGSARQQSVAKQWRAANVSDTGRLKLMILLTVFMTYFSRSMESAVSSCSIYVYLSVSASQKDSIRSWHAFIRTSLCTRTHAHARVNTEHLLTQSADRSSSPSVYSRCVAVARGDEIRGSHHQPPFSSSHVS